MTEYKRALMRIRLERDMQQSALADLLGITRAYLSSIENGYRTIPSWMTKLINKKLMLSEEEYHSLVLAEIHCKTEMKFPLHKENYKLNKFLFLLKNKESELTEDQLDKLIACL